MRLVRVGKCQVKHHAWVRGDGQSAAVPRAWDKRCGTGWLDKMWLVGHVITPEEWQQATVAYYHVHRWQSMTCPCY